MGYLAKKNILVFENKRQSLQQTSAVADSLFYQEADTNSDHNESSQEVKWIPPPNFCIKGNFDVFLKDKSGTGFGVIFSDNFCY